MKYNLWSISRTVLLDHFFLPSRTISSRSPSPLPIFKYFLFKKMFQSEFIFCKWTESQKLFILYSSDQHPKNTEFNGIKPWWFLTDFWLAEPNMLNWMNMLNCRSALFAMKWLIFDSSCVNNIFERRIKSFVNSSRSRKWNPNDVKNKLFKLVRSIWTRKFNPRVWKAESSVAPNWRHFEKFYFSLTSMIR